MVVFTATSFLGSALLFLVQPLVGRLLLPRAGGSASLWNTAMVFFQVSLLLGYLFTHLATNRLGVSRHRFLHLAVLTIPVMVLPLAVPNGWALDASRPVLDTLTVLALMVGLPFFALATASPTLQRWFGETGHPQAHDPYFLYAAGNVGSIGALLGYPLLVEPNFGLSGQVRGFSALYVMFVLATLACAATLRGAPSAQAAVTKRTSIAWARRAKWVVLSAVPAALLLGTTRHIAADVASFPLLWVVPLTLYLLTFVIAFRSGSERFLPRTNAVMLVGAVGLTLSFLGMSLVMSLSLHLAWMFVAALLGHLRLAADRPGVEHLTEFYAWLSFGGALGGATVALVAPMVFDRVWEYPLAIVAAVALAVPLPRAVVPKLPARLALLGVVALLLAAGAWLRIDGQLRVTGVVLALASAVCYFATRNPKLVAVVLAVNLVVIVALAPTDTLLRERSFFGTYEVRERSDGGVELVSGTTIHGQQLLSNPGQPSSYYHPDGPLGDVFVAPAVGPRSIGVVGLGAGEIAAYGKPGDTITFFEIDPVVADIALDARYFTHLSDSAAAIEIEIGDGRILLEQSDETFDVLVIDAFSSDAIPIHLLTVEAVDAYFDRIDDGVLLMHISNRYFDLSPVLARVAEELGVEARHFAHSPTRADYETGARASRWMALSRPDSTVGLDADWRPLEGAGRLWTDDYSDILSTLDL